jgi:hypothetical protein
MYSAERPIQQITHSESLESQETIPQLIPVFDFLDQNGIEYDKSWVTELAAELIKITDLPEALQPTSEEMEQFETELNWAAKLFFSSV